MDAPIWIQTVDGELLNAAHVRRIHLERRGNEYVIIADVTGAGVGGHVIDHHHGVEAAQQALSEIAELLGARRPTTAQLRPAPDSGAGASGGIAAIGGDTGLQPAGPPD